MKFLFLSLILMSSVTTRATNPAFLSEDVLRVCALALAGSSVSDPSGSLIEEDTDLETRRRQYYLSKIMTLLTDIPVEGTMTAEPPTGEFTYFSQGDKKNNTLMVPHIQRMLRLLQVDEGKGTRYRAPVTLGGEALLTGPLIVQHLQNFTTDTVTIATDSLKRQGVRLVPNTQEIPRRPTFQEFFWKADPQSQLDEGKWNYAVHNWIIFGGVSSTIAGMFAGGSVAVYKLAEEVASFFPVGSPAHSGWSYGAGTVVLGLSGAVMGGIAGYFASTTSAFYLFKALGIINKTQVGQVNRPLPSDIKVKREQEWFARLPKLEAFIEETKKIVKQTPRKSSVDIWAASAYGSHLVTFILLSDADAPTESEAHVLLTVVSPNLRRAGLVPASP